jgi:hypothetical protein
MSRESFRGEPKRLLDKAATYLPEGAIMAREQAQALIEKSREDVERPMTFR